MKDITKDDAIHPTTDSSSALESKVEEPTSSDAEDRRQAKPDDDLTKRYRVWRCNGVPIGLHFTGKKRARRKSN